MLSLFVCVGDNNLHFWPSVRPEKTDTLSTHFTLLEIWINISHCNAVLFSIAYGPFLIPSAGDIWHNVFLYYCNPIIWVPNDCTINPIDIISNWEINSMHYCPSTGPASPTFAKVCSMFFFTERSSIAGIRSHVQWPYTIPTEFSSLWKYIL